MRSMWKRRSRWGGLARRERARWAQSARGLGIVPALPTVVVAALAAIALLLGCAESPGPTAVILISVDTLRTDALGRSNEWVSDRRPDTPVVDALLDRGTHFRDAVAPMPRTTPSLASLLTGLQPSRHGSREVGDVVTAGTLLSERLAEAGYRTLAVSANQAAGPLQHLDRGFDAFVGGRDLKERYEGRLYRDRAPVSSRGIGWAEATTNEAIRLIDQSDADRPLFLWAFYFDPHFMYRPPSPWQDDVEAAACWDLMERLEDGEITCGEITDDLLGDASAALRDCRRLYQVEMDYTDHQIGRLLDALDERGLLDNALVVFTADHGENLGEDGLFYEHGDNVHDHALRVPLAFAGPGVAAGRVDDGLAGLIDVVPTVLDLLGLPFEQLDGVSLRSRLRPNDEATRDDSADGPSARRAIYSEAGTNFCSNSSRKLVVGRMEGRHCVHGPRHTLCRTPDGETTIFDRQLDPLMSDPLDSVPLELEQALLAGLERWPPETARERVLRVDGYSLVQTPRWEGGYHSTLWRRVAGGKAIDVTGERPRLLANLSEMMRAAVEATGAIDSRALDPELIRSLEDLGYIQ